jgi:predicted ribosomally synthesized peptide with SipW-like signal peptide
MDMTRTRKALLSVLVVGVLGAVAGLGSLAAFTAQTTSAGNRVRSGTVAVTTNAPGAAVYDFADARPGVPQSRCVRVVYGGSLAARIRMAVSPGITDGSRFAFTVERGTATGTLPDCGTFTPGGSIYSGDLGAFPTDPATSSADIRGADFTAAGQSETLRLTVTAKDDGSAGGFDSGAHTFTWEARTP